MTELHMIDVGQGDAVALRTRGGRWVLFDAGRIWEGGDAGRRTVIPYIAHRGGRLAAFVLSLRHIGTARTGAYVSLAPFVGAIVALLLLHEPLSWLQAAAIGSTVISLWLALVPKRTV